VEDVFVVNAPIENAPEDRGARVLQSLLDDPAKVMRFLRLLLALEPLDLLTELADAAEGDNGLNGARNGASESPLLEAMVRVLDRDPARLDAMERVVRDLLATEDGRRSLPPEFLSAWEPIREARRALTKETES
jgi:hypothetical protein